MIGKSVWLASGACVLAIAGSPAYAAEAENADKTNAPQWSEYRQIAQGQQVAQAQGQQSPTLEQRVRELEEKLNQKEQDDTAARTRLSTLEQAFADTVWSFDNGRPTIQSADARFLMSIRYRLQADFAGFAQASDVNVITPLRNVQFKDLNSGVAVRRFYFGAEGRVFRDFWYELRMDFGGANLENTNAVVNLARVAYNYGNLAYSNVPHFRINAGIIQPMFTYGDSVSSASTTFLERADVVNVAIAGFGGDDHRRGVELTFEQSDMLRPGDNLVLSGAFTGELGATPGQAFTRTDEGDQVVGRGVYRFFSDGFSNFQVGANGAHIINLTGVQTPGGARSIALQDRPEVRVDGNRLVSTASSTLLGTSTAGANIPQRGGDLWGVEGGGNFMNFFVYGEYMQFGVARDIACNGCTPFGGTAGVNPGDPQFHGWYVEGTWILTGETKTYSPLATNNEYATFNNPRVITPFDPVSGNWGAWEVAARYSDLDLNWNPGSIGQTPAEAPVGGVRGGEEKIVTVGLNWYLNNNVLLRFNYLNGKVDKLGFITTGTSTVLGQVGQNFSVYALRLQISN